jgi:hypothetical protein
MPEMLWHGEKKNERILSIDASQSIMFAAVTSSDGKMTMEPTNQRSLRLATAGNDGVRVGVRGLRPTVVIQH